MMKDAFMMISLVCIAAAVTGCSLHRPYVTDSVPDIPESFSNTDGRPAPPAGRWWEAFEDEHLNSLMDEALSNNLDIARSIERLQQSKAAARISDSSREVTAAVDGTGGRSRQSGFFPGGSGAPAGFGTVTDSFSLSAAASYEIDLWGKLKAESRAAHYDSLASEEDLKALFISISAQAADLYYLAAEQRAQLELSDQTIASFSDTLDLVERRYRQGLVPALDVYQSRQNLALARAQRPVFESKLSETRNALSVMTGRFSGEETVFDIGELTAVQPFAAGIPSQLLINRPDIRAAVMTLKASDERAGAAVADRFPSFNLVGSYGGSSDRVRSLLDSPNIFWNLLLQVAQPVLDAGRRKAVTDRAEAVFRENLHRYHYTVLNAFREVEDALVALRVSEERTLRLQESVFASENSLRLALDRYMQGLTDYLPVLTEQSRRFSAESSLLSARRQGISDTIRLARALGGEWTSGVVKQYGSAGETGEEER